MTKTKSTKRALLMSVLSLLACVSMLIGSTFAWFTDSVTSGSNKIVAGNLDVELYHSDKAVTDERVSDTIKLFDDITLWEPGAMVWEKLTVKNLGSLALKYTLNVNISDVSVVNGKSLADVLKVAVLDVQPTRENIVTAAKQNLATFALESDKELEAKTGVDEFYVAIYWTPSSKDNDYNVAGEKLYANLGVTLVATQATVESDSFDDQYDKDAEYENAAKKVGTYADFLAAIVEGGAIQLTSDIVVEDVSTVISKDTTIDLNGKTITGTRGYDGSNSATAAVLTVSGAKLTIVGKGKVENETANNVQNYAVLVTGGGKAIIEDGTYIGDESAVYVENGEAIIKGGFFEAHGATSPVPDHKRTWEGQEYIMYLAAVINCSKNAYINYCNGDLDGVWANVDVSGGTFVNEDPSNLYEGWIINETHVIDGYKVVRTEQTNGDAWYTVVAE